MKIALFNGGLGNQIFQYIFARALEISSGEKCWLDDSYFFISDDHNGYELEKIFGIKTNRLSEYFDPDVWESMISNVKNGFSIPQQFKESGNDLFVVAETSDFKFDGNFVYAPANKYTPEILNSQGNVYYHGYWVTNGWLQQNKEILTRELTFPTITDEYNLKLAEKIKLTNSISIHIRRGDFVKLGWELPDSFYMNSIKSFIEQVPDGQYFLFSDDIEWCKLNAKSLGLNLIEDKLIVVEGNIKGKNYLDMQLMSMCKGMIIANSSFSYLAALLNKNLRWISNPTPNRKV